MKLPWSFYKKPKYFQKPILMGEYQVLPHHPIPPNIPKPYYFESKGQTKFVSTSDHNELQIHKSEYIEKMRLAARIAAGALQAALDYAKPGVTGEDIDKICHDYILSHGAYPAAIYYMGFPKSLCISPNEIVCHGIPNLRPFEDGDIINFDVVTWIDGVFGDNSDMAMIGNSHPEEIIKLVNTTRESVVEAIKVCKPGTPINKIGEVIEDYVTERGFGLCQEFCGHGIGRHMHCPPPVLFNKNIVDTIMRPGMTFTIEPIVMMNKNYELGQWDDKWTIIDLTMEPSAQCEHTVLITETGNEVLTKRPL